MPFDLSPAGDCRPLLRVMRMDPDAVMPAYATDGSAAFDLCSTRDVLLHPGCQQSIPLGWAVEVPPDHVMLLFGRSGLAGKHRVSLGNCVGVIDSDYRGEVCALLTIPHAWASRDYIITKGMRVAQGLIVRAPQYGLVEVDELSDTARGEGGFGSTGS